MNKSKPSTANYSQITEYEPSVIWFTGLSGAGKTTLANEINTILFNYGIKSCIFDGDDLRKGLNKDLGFSQEDRTENVRRTSELCSVMKCQGFVVISALISPLQSQRDLAKSIIKENFYDVFVDTPFDVCKERDVKGLYKAAEAGKIKNFTGKTSSYEPPPTPFIHLKYPFDLEQSAKLIISKSLNITVH